MLICPPAINSYKTFRPLRKNDDLFRTARLIEDGDVVAWDRDELEMTAEMVEELAEQSMTSKDLGAFMKRNNLTQVATAALLDRSLRQIGYSLSGKQAIPRWVALACYGYDAKQRDQHAIENMLRSLLDERISVKYETREGPKLPRPNVKIA